MAAVIRPHETKGVHMGNERRRRITPSMIVATAAVVLAAGGTAVAGTLINGSSIRNGTIAGAKLRNGTITGINVRNFALPGQKLKDDSVTGRQVDESSLVGLQPGRLVTRKLALGEQAEIFKTGPLSISARCFNNGVSDVIDLYAVTSVAGSVMRGVDLRLGGPGLTLDPGTPQADRQLMSNAAPAGTRNVDASADTGFVLAPDGTRITVAGDTATLGLNYLGAKCFVALYAVADRI